MKRTLAFFAVAAALSCGAQAQNVVAWNLAGDTGSQVSEAASFSASNVAGSAITRGSGLVASAAGNSFSSAGWESAVSGFGSTEYMSFGFTVADGYSVDLSSLQLGTRSSNTGPGTLGLFYGVNSFVSQLYTFTQSDTNTLLSNIDLSPLANVTGAVEFRIYEIGNTQAGASVATASGGTFRLAGFDALGNVGFSGTVSAVPEPETFAMLLAGLGLIGAVIRRRQTQFQTS